jgi:hypothetical protein
MKVFTPLPGTPVWQLVEKKGLVSATLDLDQCDFTFKANSQTSITLSNKLNHAQLGLWHKRLKRFARWLWIRALPHSPWVNEIPKVARRVLLGKLRTMLRRVAGTMGTV